MQALRDADLLVLDDIGAEKWTDWTESTLYFIVDRTLSLEEAPRGDHKLRPRGVGESASTSALWIGCSEMCTLVENRASSYRRERGEGTPGGAKA